MVVRTVVSRMKVSSRLLPISAMEREKNQNAMSALLNVESRDDGARL
jgi:hypothetical protein